MYFMGLALAQEMRDFPGGGKGLEASVLPGASALRIMRWPAERLDTLGGYLTYHNVTLFALFLAIYAVLQGARAIRGGEDRHSLEEILATGWSRWAVIRDRTIAFALLLALICLGLGLGTAASLAASGEPNLRGSLITMLAVGLCAMVGYSLALLLSQLTPTARAASGVTALILTALYVGTNVWEELGWLGAIRFISPFYYFNFSRALVPGYGLDVPACIALLVMNALLLALAARAFEHRDYRSTLWIRRSTRERIALAPGKAQQRLLGSVWRANLLRGRVGLIAWSLSAAVFTWLMMYLEPSVMEMWSFFSKYMPGTSGVAGGMIEDQYVAFSGEIVAPIIAAYVVTQAAGWVNDLAQGRVETILAEPVSWSRLVWERLAAIAVGVACIAAGATAGLLAGAASAGLELDWAGLGRMAASTMLLGAALGAVAAIVVAGVRSAGAVTALGVFIGASYLVGYLARIFNWPDWTARFNLFNAYGHPYLEWPGTGNLMLLLSLAIGGGLVAAAIAERTPKVA
jgi:ABC-2 type transport system permease protein